MVKCLPKMLAGKVVLHSRSQSKMLSVAPFYFIRRVLATETNEAGRDRMGWFRKRGRYVEAAEK